MIKIVQAVPMDTEKLVSDTNSLKQHSQRVKQEAALITERMQ